jgi:hypothetical protein
MGDAPPPIPSGLSFYFGNAEGGLRIVALDELENVDDLLASPTKYALEIFLKLEQATEC